MTSLEGEVNTETDIELEDRHKARLAAMAATIAAGIEAGNLDESDMWSGARTNDWNWLIATIGGTP